MTINRKPRYSMVIQPKKDYHKVTIKCEAYGKTSLEAAENAKNLICQFIERAKEMGELNEKNEAKDQRNSGQQ